LILCSSLSIHASIHCPGSSPSPYSALSSMSMPCQTFDHCPRLRLDSCHYPRFLFKPAPPALFLGRRFLHENASSYSPTYSKPRFPSAYLGNFRFRRRRRILILPPLF
jgi:hypothetical protein